MDRIGRVIAVEIRLQPDYIPQEIATTGPNPLLRFRGRVPLQRRPGSALRDASLGPPLSLAILLGRPFLFHHRPHARPALTPGPHNPPHNAHPPNARIVPCRPAQSNSKCLIGHFLFADAGGVGYTALSRAEGAKWRNGMILEQAENADNADEQPPPSAGGSGRERSLIAFPYNDLDDAVEIAKAIHEHAGISCSLTQLAAYAGQSVSSGAFRLRVSNASTFGLTENERREVRLTPLGRMVADPAREPQARVDSFLYVPLYRRIFEHHDGYTLPGAAPLERFMREIGVSSKQTGKARQAFMRSARQAGFFAHGEDRLVRPSFPGGSPGTRPIEPSANGEDAKKTGGGSGSDLPPLDGLILALVKKLPPAGTADWKAADRIMWLQMAAMAFQMAYGPAELIEVKIAAPNKGE